MKKMILRSLKNNGPAFAVAALGVVALSNPAMASGLDQAQTYLTTLKTQLTTIIPIVCVIAMLILSGMYAGKMLQKDALVHWFIGVTLGGSASEIVSMFFTGS